MIRPEDMTGFTDPLEKIFFDLQERIMADVVRRIRKTGEITRTADQQLDTIRRLGGSKSFIRAELKRLAGLTDQEIRRLYADVIEKGYSVNASTYRRMGRNFIPAEENRILQRWKAAVIDQTSGEIRNITRSLGMTWEVKGQRRLLPLADVYQQALDEAAMDIMTGGKSYNTVLKHTVGQLTRSGLRTVDYASGSSARVEVAARRAVMTGVHQLTGQINLQTARELETDYFEVTWHAGARPDHWWGGRVYSRQQLSLVCGYGSAGGLCGVNCRHSFYAFIPGVSQRMYSDEQLTEMNEAQQVKRPYVDGKSYDAYEATQKQREMERTMRGQRERIHLLQLGKADEQDIMMAKIRYQGQLQEYRRFSKAMKLPEQMDRVYIDGLGRKAEGITTLQSATKPIVNTEKNDIIKVARKRTTNKRPVSVPVEAATTANGKTRAAKYGAEWPEASLQDILQKYAPNAQGYMDTSRYALEKVNYDSEDGHYTISYDFNGEYFRIQDNTKTGRRIYVGLNGENMSNETVDGRQKGRTKTEYERVTHFRNSDAAKK